MHFSLQYALNSECSCVFDRGDVFDLACVVCSGTVTLWSPNIKQPLVKMLCQGGATRSIAVDHTGQ